MLLMKKPGIRTFFQVSAAWLKQADILLFLHKGVLRKTIKILTAYFYINSSNLKRIVT